MSETPKIPALRSKVPSHGVYHIHEYTSGKSTWSRIGNAWAHADGKGFNVQIDTVPLDGRLGLRTIENRTK